jgi:hypothetical protein
LCNCPLRPRRSAALPQCSGMPQVRVDAILPEFVF